MLRSIIQCSTQGLKGTRTVLLIRTPLSPLSSSSSSSVEEVEGRGYCQRKSSMKSWSKPLSTSSSSSPLILVPGTPAVINRRKFSIYNPLCNKDEVAAKAGDGAAAAAGGDEPEEEGNDESATASSDQKGRRGKPTEPVARHMDKDRTKVIPVDVGIRYLKSPAYLETYGTEPVWVRYRRNFPGQFPPKLTRKNCVKHGKLWTGNPCPICRDIYLVVHEENVSLLKQFVSPYNGQILSYEKTNVCRFQHAKLMLAIEKAKDLGLFTFDVPFREYDYEEYAKIYESYK